MRLVLMQWKSENSFSIKTIRSKLSTTSTVENWEWHWQRKKVRLDSCFKKEKEWVINFILYYDIILLRCCFICIVFCAAYLHWLDNHWKWLIISSAIYNGLTVIFIDWILARSHSSLWCQSLIRSSIYTGVMVTKGGLWETLALPIFID